MIVCRPFDIPGLGFLNCLCRVLPDFLLHEPGTVAQDSLAHKLGAVGPLGAYIFLFHLKNFAMHKAVD